MSESDPHTAKQRLKHLAFRLMRPGLAPLQESIAEANRDLKSLHDRLDQLDADQKKYDSELEYWRWLVKKGGSEKAWGHPFAVIFGRWTQQKMVKIGEFLGLPPIGEPGSIEDWAKTRAAVEIGAGPYPLLAAAGKGWRQCVAVDPIARGYVEEGLVPPEAGHVVYVAARGESIPLPSASADVVVIENCLDHVRDPAQVVREIDRLLVPGGHLWIFVDLSNHVDHMHPHAMNEEKVRGLLKGFEIVRDEVTGHKAHPEAYGSYCGMLRKPDPARVHGAGAPAAQDMRIGSQNVRVVVETASELSPNGLAGGRPHN